MRPAVDSDTLKWLAWLCGDDWGLSSRAILFAAMGASDSLPEWNRYAYPLDPSDLGRCYRMLERFPWAWGGIEILAERSKHWAAIRSHWAELRELYDRELRDDGEYAHATYERMKELGL